MMKIEASRSAFSSCNDRFVKNYRKDIPFEEQLRILQKIEHIYAIPVTFERGVDPIQRKKFLERYDIAPGTIVLNTYSNTDTIHGTLTNRNPEIRAEFTKKAKEAMDFCAEIGGVDVMLWLAHDGYDYPFEDNYSMRYGWLVENLYDIASYRKDVNVTIEYKAADPRITQYISTATKALAICNEVDLPNLGVILDYGHALIANENPAESAALLNRYNRLFHIHLSDNYSKTDDDMLIGSVTLWRTLEFFYQLQEIGYDGNYVLDIWMPRMDGVEATKATVKRVVGLWEIASKLPKEKLKQYQNENNVTAIYDLLGRHVLGI